MSVTGADSSRPGPRESWNILPRRSICPMVMLYFSRFHGDSRNCPILAGYEQKALFAERKLSAFGI